MDTPTGIILAIDPGPTQSAYCLYRESEIVSAAKVENVDLLESIRAQDWEFDALAVEMIASYGMAVGAETFQTCVWIGRFAEAWESQAACREATLVPRLAVKLHLCKRGNAKDPNVRQALIDRFGGSAALIKSKRCPVCKGMGWRLLRDETKRCPKCTGTGSLGADGALAGITGDCWSALGVAITVAEGEQRR